MAFNIKHHLVVTNLLMHLQFILFVDILKVNRIVLRIPCVNGIAFFH